jgi:hypothetical protein
MKLLKYTSICLVIALILLSLPFILSIFGNPIHDLNAWMLEKNFYAKNIKHPAGSVLLEKKVYLGGISTHGDPWCVYAVGEVRSSALSNTDIVNFYRDITVNLWAEKLPIKVLFGDDREPYGLPYAHWQDELRGASTDEATKYIVYAGVEWPIWFFDNRCDD